MTTTIPALLLHFVGLAPQCTSGGWEIGSSGSSPQDKKVDSLGGYRLVRRLGAGARSDVWLGSDGAETTAIKVFREGLMSEHVVAEIEALGRASHRHLMRLDDLAMSPNGMPCLILQRLSQWNLGRVMVGARPSDGEAVTILAPLCLAVTELHRVGVAHGGIRASSVHFDDRGAPVLTSFGGAELFGPLPVAPQTASVTPAQLVKEKSVATDLDALTTLCIATLHPGSDVARWLATPRERESHIFAAELADRIFRLSAAAPVHFGAPSWGAASALIPLRLNDAATDRHTGAQETTGLSAGDPLDGPSGRVSATAEAAKRFSVIMHMPEALVSSVFEWCSAVAERGPVSMAVRRAKDALRPVRKPVWIFAGLVAACVVAVVAMMPPGSGGGAGQAEPRALISPAPTPFSSAELSAITGDDPLTAASALLDARDECIEALSILCLDSVDQHGSAAMEADAVQVRLMQEGGVAYGSQTFPSTVLTGSTTVRQLAIVERLGDSVLLSISVGEEDAAGAALSLLLIKLEEGWRIRDLTPMVHTTY